MKESSIEKHVTKYAKSLGWLPFKFASPNHKGVPDHLYIRNGETIYVEYKQKGKLPRGIQEYTILKMREHGAKVFVIDSVNAGKELFNAL